MTLISHVRDGEIINNIHTEHQQRRRRHHNCIKLIILITAAACLTRTMLVGSFFSRDCEIQFLGIFEVFALGCAQFVKVVG
jgi:hypothetical protein